MNRNYPGADADNKTGCTPLPAWAPGWGEWATKVQSISQGGAFKQGTGDTVYCVDPDWKPSGYYPEGAGSAEVRGLDPL